MGIHALDLSLDTWAAAVGKAVGVGKQRLGETGLLWSRGGGAVGGGMS